MKQLIMIKKKIKKFVGKYEVFISPVLKFLVTFMCMSKINSGLGFKASLASTPIALIVGLAGSFLPMNLTILILAALILIQVYTLNLECAIVVLALFLVLLLLYFRFASKDSYACMLTPLAIMFKVPCVMPISMGLVGTPSAMVSVGSGVIVYNVLHYISQNAKTFAESSDKIDGDSFKAVIDALLVNKNMLVTVASFAATILVVYIIRRLPINYCWYIAIGAGMLTLLISTAVCNSIFKGSVSVGGVFGGAIVSGIINVILEFFVFGLDYNKIERVQFEDDEYYYYVKAIPKNDSPAGNRKKAVAGSTAPKKTQTAGAALRRPATAPARKPVGQTTRTPVSNSTKSDYTPIDSDFGATIDITKEAAHESEKKPALSTLAEQTINNAKGHNSNSANKGPWGLSGGRRPQGSANRNNIRK